MHNIHIRKDARFGRTVINVAQPVGTPIIEKGLGEVGVLQVGRGSTFTFTLPLGQRADKVSVPATATSEVQPEQPRKSEKVKPGREKRGPS